MTVYIHSNNSSPAKLGVIPVRSTAKGFILKLKVQPGSSRNEVAGSWQDSLKVKVTAPPEAGKANKACLNLLAQVLGLPAKNIEIIKGQRSLLKQVCILGITEQSLRQVLVRFK